MTSSDINSLCSICLTSDEGTFWKCAKCHINVHQECAELFGLKQKSTEKYNLFLDYVNLLEKPNMRIESMAKYINILKLKIPSIHKI